MDRTSKGYVGDRDEWILRLLFTSSDGSRSGRLTGRTRLMKGAFLLDRKLEEEFEEPTSFQFEAGKYGPFDKGVFEATEQLEDQGFLDIRKRTGQYMEDLYMLTDEGEERAKELMGEIFSEERDLIEWINGKHLSNPLSKILSFVYNQYPEYTTNSKIA